MENCQVYVHFWRTSLIKTPLCKSAILPLAVRALKITDACAAAHFNLRCQTTWPLPRIRSFSRNAGMPARIRRPEGKTAPYAFRFYSPKELRKDCQL